ncbi:unnamed protein product [Rotaria magnacalcarata]|uniref:Uncharacterized protein n=1 Tax=Rotaria magnacalcarata TaxID=392030 RepID=A0A8S3I8S5_9BILA|nr:unnamed protein product [Rotaria magnacalcarata]
MACATLFLLLLERSKSYELPSIANESSSCTHSMHRRYLKRIFIIVQSLSTLSKIQLNDMQTNFERYIAILVNQLYQTDYLQEKINDFIDKNLFGNNLDDDSASSGFVFIRQFPIFNEDSIDKYNDLMNMCLVSTFDQCK